MKKIITLVITIAMVFTMTVPAFADEVATSQTKPNKVQNLTVNKYNYNTLRVTWTADAEATAYDIYRSQTKKSFKKVGTATEPTYRDSSLTSGKTYYYKVRATNDLGKASYSDMAYNRPQPGTAKITSVKYDNSGKNKYETQVLLKVSWNKVNGADKYQVYRTIKGKNKFKRIATVSKLSYTDNFTDIASSYREAASKEYQYKVRAYKVEGKNKVYGYKSKIVGYTPDWTVDEIKEYLIKEGESVVLYEYEFIDLDKPIVNPDNEYDITYVKEIKTDRTYTMKHADEPSTTPEGSTWGFFWPQDLNIYNTGKYLKEDLAEYVKSDIASYGEASPKTYVKDWGYTGRESFIIYTRVEDGDMVIYCLF